MKTKSRGLCTVGAALCSFLASGAGASEARVEAYGGIDRIEFARVAPTETPEAGKTCIEDPLQAHCTGGERGFPSEGGDVLPILHDILNFGRELFSFISENRPVIDSRLDFANALPKGLTQESWEDMEGWQEPRWQRYEFEVKSLFGITVAKFPFYVFYTPGGRYRGEGMEEAKGRYLTGISVREDGLHAAWAHKVSADVRVNVGNAGTKDDPVAFADLSVQLQVDGPLNSKRTTASFLIKGDGSLKVQVAP